MRKGQAHHKRNGPSERVVVHTIAFAQRRDTHRARQRVHHDCGSKSDRSVKVFFKHNNKKLTGEIVFIYFSFFEKFINFNFFVCYFAIHYFLIY